MSEAKRISIDVDCCVEDLVKAYFQASVTLDRIQVSYRRAQDNAAPAHQILVDSIELASNAILRAKKVQAGKIGRAFSEGDAVTIVTLQSITIELQSQLLYTLRDGIDIGNTGEQLEALVQVVDKCKDKAIETLQDLGVRLAQAESTFEDAPDRYRARRHASIQDGRILKSSQESSPVRAIRPDHRRTWTREYTSGDDDTDAGAKDQQSHARRYRHSSFLGFFRTGRSNTGVLETRPSIPRRESANPAVSPDEDVLFVEHARDMEAPQKVENDRPNSTHQGDDPTTSNESLYQRRRMSRSAALPLQPSYLPSQVSTAPTMAVSPRRPGSTNIPVPNPDNNYLGFCKGAWRLQTGDRSAIKKLKEFNDGWSHASVYYLGCSFSKCAFAGHIALDVIWTKVWTMKEDIGIKFRWPFLAKSHVTQSKVRDHQFVFQCMFCTFMGLEAPHFQGTELYLEHISQEHRGQTISEVILYKVGCVNDRICDESDVFDINLFPFTPEEEFTFRRRHVSGPPPDELLDDAHFDGGTDTSEPWNQGLSEFHMDVEWEMTERA